MRAIGLLCAAILATACVRTSTNPATGKVDVDIESPTKQGEDWSGKMNGVGPYSGVSGETKGTHANGTTTISISLSGAASGSSFPWAIHEGRCSMQGALVGTMSSYPNINIGPDGRGNATASFPARLDEAKQYVVVVHHSHAAMETVVACGDLDD